MEYIKIQQHEMKPDIYGGKECNKHIPMWNSYAEGDMGDETDTVPLVFEAKGFPPGTRIIVESPVCPKCNEVYDNCIVRSEDGCDFDWNEWTENEYS